MPLEQHDIDRVVWYLTGWPYDEQFASYGLPIPRRGSNILSVCYWLR